MTVRKRVMITGGSSGLGLALAQRLAADHDLALVARDGQKLERAVAGLRERHRGAEVHGHSIDVSEPTAGAALAAAADAMGGLDVLINSAGILREGGFATLSDEDFHRTLEINLLGTVTCIRALLPHLEASRGRVVNIASIAGLTGVYGYSAYCSSKFALVGLSESLRFELAPKGIVVQIACPPEFDSPMIDALDRTRTPENAAHTLTIPKLGIDACADGILAGIRRDRFMIIPGARSRLLALGIRHLPGLSRWLGARKIRAASRRARPRQG